MKILVTGATGFIGKNSIEMLLAKGYEVHITSRQKLSHNSHIRSHELNLLDTNATANLVKEIRPTHLLHFAWDATPGKYWTSPENLDWVQTTLTLIKSFTSVGGKRLVMAGTCAEYDWEKGRCFEDTTTLNPLTLYGVYKNSTQQMLAAWSKETGLSSAWGRIFSVYGPHEHPSRLASSFIKNLLMNQKMVCHNGNLVRDYLHAADVARAFVHLVDAECLGPVNIASGDGIPLRDLVLKIGQITNREHLLEIKSMQPSALAPEILVGDNEKLKSLGWKPHFSLDSGLRETVAWWQNELENMN